MAITCDEYAALSPGDQALARIAHEADFASGIIVVRCGTVRASEIAANRFMRVADMLGFTPRRHSATGVIVERMKYIFSPFAFKENPEIRETVEFEGMI